MLFNAANMQLAAGAGAEQTGMMAMLMQLSPIILIVFVFYFMMIRPQRKRDKAIQEMRSKIEVGDEVVTVGGVVGTVVSIREDSLVIETGSDRSKIRIMRWSVQTNNTVHDNTETAK